MLNKLRDVRLWLEVLLAIGVLVFAVLYVQKLFAPAPVGETVVAPPAKVIADVPKEKLDCSPVVVYAAQAKKKVPLPKVVQADPNKALLTAVNVKPDLHEHMITATLDKTTGEVTTYDTRKPFPLFAIDTRGHFGVGYGTSDVGSIVGVEAQQALFDVKGTAVVGKANADFPLDGGAARWKIMAFGLLRW